MWAGQVDVENDNSLKSDKEKIRRFCSNKDLTILNDLSDISKNTFRKVLVSECKKLGWDKIEFLKYFLNAKRSETKSLNPNASQLKDKEIDSNCFQYDRFLLIGGSGRDIVYGKCFDNKDIKSLGENIPLSLYLFLAQVDNLFVPISKDYLSLSIQREPITIEERGISFLTEYGYTRNIIPSGISNTKFMDAVFGNIERIYENMKDLSNQEIYNDIFQYIGYYSKNSTRLEEFPEYQEYRSLRSEDDFITFGLRHFLFIQDEFKNEDEDIISNKSEESSEESGEESGNESNEDTISNKSEESGNKSEEDVTSNNSINSTESKIPTKDLSQYSEIMEVMKNEIDFDLLDVNEIDKTINYIRKDKRDSKRTLDKLKDIIDQWRKYFSFFSNLNMFMEIDRIQDNTNVVWVEDPRNFKYISTFLNQDREILYYNRKCVKIDKLLLMIV